MKLAFFEILKIKRDLIFLGLIVLGLIFFCYDVNLNINNYLADLSFKTELSDNLELDIYNDYIVDLNEQVEKYQSSTLLSKNNTYAVRYNRLALKYYNNIKEFEGKNDIFLHLFFENGLEISFSILICLYLSVKFIGNEINEKITEFIKTLKNYRLKRFIVVFNLIVIIGFFSFLLLKLIKWMFLKDYVSDIHWSSNIQNISGYIYSPFNWSILSFLIISYIYYGFVIIFFSLFFMLVAKKLYIFKYYIVFIIFIFLISFSFYSGIKNQSEFVTLKYFNFVALLDFNSFVKTLNVINIFSYPIFSINICLLFGVIVIICTLIYVRYYDFKILNTIKNKKNYPILNLIFLENKKILFSEKNIIFIILIIICLGYFGKFEFYPDIDAYYFNHYSNLFEGQTGDKQLQLIDELDNYYQNLNDEYLIIYNIDNKTINEYERLSNLNNKLLTFNGYLKAKENYLSKSMHLSQFVNTFNYNRTVNSKTVNYLITIIIVFCSFMIANIGCYEKSNGMCNYLKVMQNGRNTIVKYDLLFICFFCWLIYSFIFIKLLCLFDFNNINLLAININQNYNFSIWIYLLILYVVFLLIGSITLFINYKISTMINNSLSAMLLIAAINFLLSYVVSIG